MNHSVLTFLELGLYVGLNQNSSLYCTTVHSVGHYGLLNGNVFGNYGVLWHRGLRYIRLVG